MSRAEGATKTAHRPIKAMRMLIFVVRGAVPVRQSFAELGGSYSFRGARSSRAITTWGPMSPISKTPER
jgi:hypothetical protein